MGIRLWGATRAVNTTTSNGQNQSVVAGLKGGGYVVAWVDDMGAAASLVRFQRFDALGNKVGAETALPVADGEGDQGGPSIAALADGGFVITVIDSDPAGAADVRVNRFDASGTLVHEANMIETYPNSPIPSATVVATAAGYSVINDQPTGVTGADNDVFAVNFNAANAQSGFGIDTSAVDTSLVTAAGLPGSDTHASIFIDPTDSAFFSNRIMFRSSPFISSPPPVVVHSLSFNVVSGLTIAAAGFNYVVGYTNGDFLSMFAGLKLIDASGVPLADIVLPLTTFTASNTRAPEVAGFADGSFAAIYIDSNEAVRLSAYTAAGALVGTSSISLGGATTPADYSITKLADGRLVLTWTDTSGQDGAGAGIFQQIVDLRDGIVDGSNDAAVAETLAGHDALGDVMRGFAGADTMYGLAGADVMYGGTGSDLLDGGRGDDTLYGDDGDDQLLGRAGDDVMYGGIGNDSLTGDAGDDLLFGEAGIDVLDGRAGADEMDGGAGSDTYYVDNALDLVFELAGGGTDQVRAYISLDMAASAGLLQVERGYLYGAAADLAGNSQHNILVGNALSNRIEGRAGVDSMTGGGARDTFVYKLITDTGNAAGARDVITDFTADVATRANATSDVLDLSAIDANTTNATDTFTFIGMNAAFTGAGQLRARTEGTNTIIEGNVNADLASDFQIQLTGLKALLATDFML